ncbi:RNA polymerase sigma factor, sigma-70 family [Pelagirhabdus alkalitolerans]|uniref:RNA polymerase sigma factor, sigma-70 family n=1 Tax=Pelagirhabdus alkalitolerans TaxID=1612202 RepID=A0A1G6KHM7_9BACI|nr:sigma-70 family RNA polymerase sigma factor [Pelagirhabdus alkalitolerans]SDC30427.1 RNA polymerase sigma factor, sigma-70 family [Pelagirhabdus alkalitolerans]
MEVSFTQLLEDFKPMIYHLLNKYHIRDSDGDYFQELSITLWKASTSYDQARMKFSTYAYQTMQFRLIDLIRKNSKMKESEERFKKCLRAEDMSFVCVDHNLTEWILDIRNCLTKNEWFWFVGEIVEGKRLVDIALEQGVSANAVRHWKRKAIIKIRNIYRNK